MRTDNSAFIMPSSSVVYVFKPIISWSFTPVHIVHTRRSGQPISRITSEYTLVRGLIRAKCAMCRLQGRLTSRLTCVFTLASVRMHATNATLPSETTRPCEITWPRTWTLNHSLVSFVTTALYDGMLANDTRPSAAGSGSKSRKNVS